MKNKRVANIEPRILSELEKLAGGRIIIDPARYPAVVIIAENSGEEEFDLNWLLHIRKKIGPFREIADYAEMLGLKPRETFSNFDFGEFLAATQEGNPCNWLFVCDKLRFKTAVGTDEYPWIFSRDCQALRDLKTEYDASGDYDTYLYETAEAHGGGAYPITPALLDSKIRRMAYVILHEAWHVTSRGIAASAGTPLMDYKLEEATGDVIGNVGAALFCRQKYGSNSEEYKNALDAKNSSHRRWQAVNALYSKLNSIYLSGKTDGKKLAAKAMVIKKYERKIGYNDTELTNAFLLNLRSYAEYASLCSKGYRLTNDLQETIKVFKTAAERGGKSVEYLTTYVTRR